MKEKYSKSKKSEQMLRKKKFSTRADRLCLLLLLLVEKYKSDVPPGPKYEMLAKKQDTRGNFVFNCDKATDTHLFSIRLKKTGGTPLTFRLREDPGNRPRPSLLENNEVPKERFVLWQPGNFCYTHNHPTGRDSYPFVMLVLKPSGKTSFTKSFCKVVHIILKNDLIPCGAGAKTDLWSVVKFKESENAHTSFRNITYVKANTEPRFVPIGFSITNLGVYDIGTRIMEMAILVPHISSPQTYSSASFIDHLIINRNNDFVEKNTAFAGKIDKWEYLQRLVIDDLPGYLLGIY